MRAFISISLVTIVSLSASACIEHAHLAPPPAKGTAEARLAAYQALSPRGFGSFQNTRSNDIGFLVLGDGTRVYFPEDLAPVVPAESPTAVAASQHRTAWQRAKHWFKIGGLGYAASIAIPLIAFAAMPDGDRRDEVMIGGSLGGVLVGTIGFTAAAVNLFESNGERASAFLTYDDSLRAELSLCVAGLEVYDCASGPAVARAPTAPMLGVSPELR